MSLTAEHFVAQDIELKTNCTSRISDHPLWLIMDQNRVRLVVNDNPTSGLHQSHLGAASTKCHLSVSGVPPNSEPGTQASMTNEVIVIEDSPGVAKQGAKPQQCLEGGSSNDGNINISAKVPAAGEVSQAIGEDDAPDPAFLTPKRRPYMPFASPLKGCADDSPVVKNDCLTKKAACSDSSSGSSKLSIDYSSNTSCSSAEKDAIRLGRSGYKSQPSPDSVFGTPMKGIDWNRLVGGTDSETDNLPERYGKATTQAGSTLKAHPFLKRN